MDGRVFLGLGANLGDRLAALGQAVKWLREAGHAVRAVSPVYESAPVGPVQLQPPFLNAVCELSAAPEPGALLMLAQALERRAGRRRDERPSGGPRELDVDLLFYGDRRIVSPHLVVPHPRWAERAFVVLPLLDLAPDFIPLGLPEPLPTLAARLGAVQRCVRTASVL